MHRTYGSAVIGGLTSPELWLLRCCANPDRGHGDLPELDKKECRHLAQLALQTRTFPLLARSLASLSNSDTPLGGLGASLSGQARSYAMTHLEQARVVTRIAALLRAEGISSIMLKGIPLAFGDYPEPHLRPLRDIDVLIAPDEAEAAQELLCREGGLAPKKGAGQYGIEYSHQLPELIDQTSGLVVEIHHRLNVRGWRQEPQLLELMRADTQEIELLGERLCVAGHYPNFLHLLEHATLHHAFSNGPLVLADLHYICSKAEFDWSKLWHECEQLGLLNALQLVLSMANRLGATWPPAELLARCDVQEEQMRAAASAMLQNSEDTRQQTQLRRLAQRSGEEIGFLAAIRRVWRPDQQQLAKLSGQSPESALRWLGYPAWLLEKGTRYWRASRDKEQAAARLRQDKLIDWLNS